jgi:putative SOS response-associated peptidase YedK
MCGRYVSPDEAAIERAWNIIRAPNPFRIVYNAAPTMVLPVVRFHEGQQQVCGMQWGLIPLWWSKPEPPRSTINARVEDAANKPMWRTAVRRARCLVPSLGWYEWQEKGTGHAKQPYFVHLPQMTLFHFAGLWSSWTPKGGEPIRTFAILTRDAAADMASIHNRMPVVLSPDAYTAWLDPALEDGAAVTALATNAAITDFEAYPVSTFVNAPRNQGEECIRGQEQ